MSGAAPVGAVVRVADLHASYRRSFGRERVLDGLSFVAEPGRITAIVGRNGEGKSTLFRILTGFQRPDSGEVTIQGVPPARFRSREGVGFAPEGQAFPPGWTVRDVLARGIDLAGVPDPSRAFARAVERGRFDDATQGRLAGRCSKGNQQRLRLAFALIGEPRAVFMDEPFAGLDPPSRVALRDQLADVAAAGSTVVLASHDLSEVSRVAHAVWVLRRGTVRPVDAVAADELEALLLEEAD